MYAEAIAKLVAQYDPDPECEEGVYESQRYLLIERDADGSLRYWFTTHSSPAMAADYHDCQEYADWTVEALIDLETLEIWSHETRTTFTLTEARAVFA